MIVGRHDGFLHVMRVILHEEQSQTSVYTLFYAGHESCVIMSQMDDL